MSTGPDTPGIGPQPISGDHRHVPAHPSGYTPLGLHAAHSAGDAAEADTGPPTVLTVRFGDAVLYLYESLLTRGVLVLDVDEAEPQPAGLRLVIGGREAFTAGTGR